MRMKVAALLLGCLLSGARSRANELIFYVAPNGRDVWSGLSAEPSANGKDGPLATLPGALEAARLARKEWPDSTAKILLREGVYELAAPVVFRPEDSGADHAHPLVIAAHPGENPILSGGRRITGWRPAAGKPGQWTTEVPPVREGRWYFRQLFVNGKRKQRARTPNTGFFHIQGMSTQSKPVQFPYLPGDIKKEWVADGEVEAVALLAWADFRLKIRGVDEARHTVTLSGNAEPSNLEKDARYYIENAPDGLDQPGEWHLDWRTGSLTYWPEANEDLTRADVTAPVLAELLRFAGDCAAQNFVHDIVIDGVGFADSDWKLARDGYADTQAAIEIHGAVQGEGAVDCAIRNCSFKRLGGYALDFGRGCRRIQIVGNEIADIGAGGVRLGETVIRTNAFESCQENVVTDNHIHALGRVYPSAAGVLILQSGRNLVAHNHIHDLYYTAISVGWTWGYQKSPCRENLIEFNHLHDIGQGMLSDMGGIYTLGIQEGTVLRNNVIHDIDSYTYGGWGIYPDEGSTGILVENNIVYRAKSAGFHQHYGAVNVIRNNIFAFGKEHQLMRTRAEPHVSFRFENNIVYYNSGDLLGSNWEQDQYWMDRNVYFDARPGAAPDSMRFAGQTLAEWRKRGHDLSSIIADPLFVAPDRDDFRLQTNSPAIKLGFQNIDPDRVGIRSGFNQAGQ